MLSYFVSEKIITKHQHGFLSKSLTGKKDQIIIFTVFGSY